jgi:hypothetical protein
MHGPHMDATGLESTCGDTGRSTRRGSTQPMKQSNESFSYLRVALVLISGLVEGQNGLKKLVDDENLTAFIYRYRYR